MKEYFNKFNAIFYTPTLIYFFLLVAVSLMAIASSLPVAAIQYSYTPFVMRQVLFFIAGSVVLICVLFMEMKRLRIIRWIFYGLCIIMLLALFADGHIPGINFSWVSNINGATRWIDAGFLSLQPSEFMRIAIILVLADIIQKHNETIPHEERTTKSDFYLILKCIAAVIIPAILIYLQPDSGITLLILITTAIMLLAAGVKWRYILAVAGIGLIIVYLFILLVVVYPEFLINTLGVHEYQIGRFDGWFDPFGTISGNGRQLALSLTAMGSGGIFGNGFQSGALFIPEAHTDFIFAIIGKDFGLFGALAVITIYILFNFEILNTAILNRGHYNSSVCVGIFASLMAQQFWNIGMTLGILPISGVTLPFISHGGSSVLSSMIMLGIILSSQIEGKTLKHHDATYQEDIVYLKDM